MDAIQVRDARREDAAWIAAANRAMALETEGVDLPLERTLRGVSALFDDARRGRYWIAEAAGAAGRAVGQVMVTYEWSDWRAADFWWIQSVYTVPEFRGKGIYSTLHRHVVAAARAAGAAGVRLYVERANERARSVYRKLGMASAPYEMMEIDFVIARGGHSTAKE